MKIAINACFGGFGLSHAATMRYAELCGFQLYPYHDHITKQIYGDIPFDHKGALVHYSRVPFTSERNDDGEPVVAMDAYFSDHDIKRDDPILIQVIEELGVVRASGNHGKLKIVEIPDDVQWTIEEYDGYESVEEVHRSWD